jgi:uncharacterized membrane protein YeaQ/YmgE (transglycosylase-associated protein family)
MFHFISMALVGIAAGLIARFLMPGNDNMGWIMTCVLGIAGSFVGGFISRLFSKPVAGSAFHAAGFVMSIVGAFIILLAVRLLKISL